MATGDRERWDARYRAHGPERAGPAPFLVEVADVLPRAGSAGGAPTALDVAGGAGRHALWLAQRGCNVTVTDVSPAGLALARQGAAAAGLSLRVVEVDLETTPLPAGPFDLVVVVDFLHRPLFDAFPTVLGPGGVLVVAHPTRTNLERHPHPSARYLLEPGELPRLVRGLRVLRVHEGWFDDRHEARLVARRT